MKLAKTLLSLPLIALSVIISACGPTSTPTDPTTDDNTSIVGPTTEPVEYDSNWTPGPNAIKGAKQPVRKLPVGEESNLNKMRRTQNRTGLPAKGKSNVLVVPIEFKDDSVVQQGLGGYSLDFSTNTLSALDDVYNYYDEEINRLPSVYQYYQTSSYESKTVDGVITPVVELPYTILDVINKCVNTGTIYAATSDIVDYVYSYLFEETQTYYIGDFDSDRDGKIDYISFVSRYPYAEIFNDSTYNDVLLSFFGPENYGFTKDLLNAETTLVNSYSFISDSFRTLDESNLASNMFVNLVGISLGLDSYVDYSYNLSTGTPRATLGYTDMMQGAIGDHSAFSKYQLGWIEPTKISANSLPQDGMSVQIVDLATKGDAILLYTGKFNEFGEYLLIDMYHPDNILNKPNKTVTGPYGTKTFSARGIRVTKVDARLVRGYGNQFNEFDGTTDFNDWIKLPNGEITQYVYDYAYTTSSINKYYNYGITANYPLVALLSKKGANRHLVDYTVPFTYNDLFIQGDVFATVDSVDGFYNNFRFDGNGQNGPLLNINFKVEEFINNKTNLKIWRAN